MSDSIIIIEDYTLPPPPPPEYTRAGVYGKCVL